MTLEERITEFWEHVWDHSTDPFHIKFDYRPPLTKQEVDALDSIVEALPERSHEEIARLIASLVESHGEELMHLLIQIVGLTRNKILTDIRAMAIDQKIPVPSSCTKLPHAPDAWKIAGPYLVARLRSVLGPVSDQIERGKSYEALNQATWPGYIRQERAKRSGHEAEYRFALVMDACGIPFEPQEKLQNPMCRDAQIYDVSFDLVVPSDSEGELEVGVKCTVHTANIGQYGESKDVLEMNQARNMFDEKYPPDSRPILLGLADGVGFKGNPEGLKGVLKAADEFCQLRTLWKGIVVCAARLGIGIPLILPVAEIELHADFIGRYGYDNLVSAKEETSPPVRGVDAGDGVFVL